jgi:hypothetical protein
VAHAEKEPLNPKIFGRIEQNGYSVEKVFFESYPGFFVTGNLYRPLGNEGPFPAVLCPHGHWGRGRLHSDNTGSVPGRCISLARQGHVVFSYDMVGYNDSTQVKHSFADELWGTSLMGLHLWNSIRSVDFISTLPDVDANRIACTGASGGGTQTFMLMAVDDRIKAAAPVCMISAHFQGGCECENAPLLRLDIYNVEIASLMAPRPLILVSATGDWTKNNPTVEYPDIRSVYELFGAGDRVASVQFNTGHNYNKDSREAVYAWFGKWMLGIPDAEKVEGTALYSRERRGSAGLHRRASAPGERSDRGRPESVPRGVGEETARDPEAHRRCHAGEIPGHPVHRDEAYSVSVCPNERRDCR